MSDNECEDEEKISQNIISIFQAMKTATCSICNLETEVAPLSIPSVDGNGKSYIYVHFPCCDYYKQIPFLTDEEMNNLYEKEYKPFNDHGIHQMLMLRIIKQRIRKFRHLIRNKDVLEIGSSTGEFLHLCKSENPKSVQGVEISEYASAIARDRYKVNVSLSTFEDFQSDMRFDTIFMFHVIEHVKDPLAVINKCKSLLRKGGSLVMETPNLASFENRFYGENWVAWQAPFHTFLFSPRSLNILSEKNNLRIIDIHYAFFSNTYSFLIPFLLKHRNKIALPYLTIKFLLKTFMASQKKESGLITAEVRYIN